MEISVDYLRIEILETWGNDREFGFGKIEFKDANNSVIPNNCYSFYTKNRIFDNTKQTFDMNIKKGVHVYFCLRRSNKNFIEITFK